jgi:hypothetical protein
MNSNNFNELDFKQNTKEIVLGRSSLHLRIEHAMVTLSVLTNIVKATFPLYIVASQKSFKCFHFCSAKSHHSMLYP